MRLFCDIIWWSRGEGKLNDDDEWAEEEEEAAARGHKREGADWENFLLVY